MIHVKNRRVGGSPRHLVIVFTRPIMLIVVLLLAFRYL